MASLVAEDWRDERIRELEAALTESDARLTESDARLTESDARLTESDARLTESDVRIAVLEAQVQALTKQVAEVLERLGQNSKNSHLPPSSDGPGGRNKGGTGKKKGRGKQKRRKRGGQPGHRGARRNLLPLEQVDEVVDHYPSACENCWESLPQVPDPDAKRYQCTEIPPVKPHTTEHRRHSVCCPDCGYKTRAPYDEKLIPSSPFGPRLMATIALLTGVYHVSRRRTLDLLRDFFGIRLSLGALSAVEARVSEAVEPAVDEAWERAEQADVKHTDGTSWLQAGMTLSLWTLATTAVTVFKIVADGSKKTLEPLYGALRGILVSDRATALNFWAMERRQVCWSHLLRKFVSFSERDGPAGPIGRELLDLTGVLFEYWHDYQDGKLTRERFVAWMTPVRNQFNVALSRAVAQDIKGVSGSCANILIHEKALWTFVEHDGVEPTNNHAEREIRAFVLWCKRSFGTQSQRGNVFAERLMTVAHTARKQNTNTLAFLVGCCEARMNETAPPSLFRPEPVAATAAV